MLYGNLQPARAAFHRGENITTCLKEQFNVDHNTPQIIEVSYDLQAGSYVDYVKTNRDFWNKYTQEIAGILGNHCSASDTTLDVGTGEMTTLAGVARHIYRGISAHYACDISWSRLKKGAAFLDEELCESVAKNIKPFVANLFNLPLVDDAVDVIWTSHALEPNGGKEKEALSELLRVARKKLVLFEPFYEENSTEGKERMNRLGYIKEIPRVISELGATIEDIKRIDTISNPLNPTYAFVIQPKPASYDSEVGNFWACPATRLPMVQREDCFWSEYSMLAYPIIQNIPILRSEAAILASAMI